MRQATTEFVVSTRGTVRHDLVRYGEDDAVMFGSETSGLPAEVIEAVPPEQSGRSPSGCDGFVSRFADPVGVVRFGDPVGNVHVHILHHAII